MTTKSATLGTYTQTRPRGFAPWAPQKRARELVEAIKTVLVEYADHLPLTLRQVFYVLVGSDRLDKTENAYERLCETVNRARRAGLLAWGAFRDDGTTAQVADTYEGSSDFLDREQQYVERHYRRDRLAGQGHRLEVWCEAAGMVPQLVRVAEPYGVAVYSSGGFDSTTAKYETARRLANESRPTVILHVGDLDPSGVAVFDALAEDLTAFVSGLDGLVPTLSRLAVTPEQVTALDLATAPAKDTDRRGGFKGQTTQAEAIAPDELARVVRNAIESRLDLDLVASVREAEARDRQALLAALRLARQQMAR